MSDRGDTGHDPRGVAGMPMPLIRAAKFAGAIAVALLLLFAPFERSLIFRLICDLMSQGEISVRNTSTPRTRGSKVDRQL